MYLKGAKFFTFLNHRVPVRKHNLSQSLVELPGGRLQRFIIEDATSHVLASGFPQEAKRFSDAPRTRLRSPLSSRPSGRRYKTAI
jgi:hypothetical protein